MPNQRVWCQEFRPSNELWPGGRTCVTMLLAPWGLVSEWAATLACTVHGWRLRCVDEQLARL